MIETFLAAIHASLNQNASRSREPRGAENKLAAQELRHPAVSVAVLQIWDVAAIQATLLCYE
jgi:hypothetical protein